MSGGAGGNEFNMANFGTMQANSKPQGEFNFFDKKPATNNTAEGGFNLIWSDLINYCLK